MAISLSSQRSGELSSADYQRVADSSIVIQLIQPSNDRGFFSGKIWIEQQGGGTPPIVIIWYFFYGSLPIKQSFGV